METALSTITVLPSTKEQRNQFIIDVVDEICNSGNINALDADIMLKSGIDTLEEIRKNDRVKELVLKEADKYPEKSFEYGNFKVTKSSRTINDFKGCDQHLDELYRQMEALKLQIKAREQLVLTGINTETGEVFKPVKSTVTEFLKIELVR